MVQILFEDIFEILMKDEGGRKFDKVSRMEAKSEKFDMNMQLDMNIEIYPVEVGEKYMVALSPTLNLDGTPDTGYYQAGKKSLADNYEYVMHGKLYKISEEGSGTSGRTTGKVEIYVSFGGLLMRLTGDPSNAAKFELDQRLFLLMRKVEGAKLRV